MNFLFVILILFLNVYLSSASSTCTIDPINFISIRGSKDRTSWIPAPKYEKCFSFYVKSEPYFYIHLSMFDLKTGKFKNFLSPYIGFENKFSGIYDEELKVEILKHVPTLNYISPVQTHGFWMSWYEGVFKIGQEGKINPFLQYQMVGNPNIQFIGFQGVSTDTLSIKIKNCYTCPGVSASKDLDAILSLEVNQNINVLTLFNVQKDLLEQIEVSSNKYDETKVNSKTTKPFLEVQLKEFEEIYTKAKNNHNELIKSDLLNSKEVTEVFNKIKSTYYNVVGAINYQIENLYPELDIRLDNSTSPIIRN